MTKPHMSLNLDVIETPYQAYVRKMPGEGGGNRGRGIGRGIPCPEGVEEGEGGELISGNYNMLPLWIRIYMPVRR